MDENTTKSFDEKRAAKGFNVPIWILLLIIVGIIMGSHVSKYIDQHKQLEELRKQPGYFAYSTYIAADQHYKFYYVLNVDETSDIWKQICATVTEEYISDLRQSEVYQRYGNHNIELRVLLPSEELEYGWMKTYMNIEAQDFSLLSRNTEYIISIPVGATSLSQCSIRVQDEKTGTYQPVTMEYRSLRGRYFVDR